MQRRHLARSRRPKKPQRVVLLRRQPVPAEQLVLERAQPVVRPPQVKKDLLLRRVEPLPRPARLCLRQIHYPEHTCSNKHCPDNLHHLPKTVRLQTYPRFFRPAAAQLAVSRHRGWHRRDEGGTSRLFRLYWPKVPQTRCYKRLTNNALPGASKGIRFQKSERLVAPRGNHDASRSH